ncbi:Dot/Icm T4SS effector [Legionella nautarum]|uniref:Dot/Icm T4SS effector n=1 Tax=Legionella nautarum TaxID=45070 RepID=A0A0W0WZH7_9GAMM|nr:hypothetical protein [Legionella nautarum]KTD37688.1 Dot/Icm T4SS effector [Legionella nautarum]
MKTEDDVLSGLDTDKWSQNSVNAVLAAKAEKLAVKGLVLNCYSLDIDPRDDMPNEKYNEDNITSFVDSIYEKAAHLKDNETLRFQVAIKVNDVHWTAVDMEVSNKSVKMLNIDALGDESGITAALDIFLKLAEKYPNYSTDSPEFKFRWLKHGTIRGADDKVQGIQYDNESCSRFTLDHLFHLNNIDSFALLEAKENDFSEYNFSKQVKSFDASNMPKEFAFLYRDSQSKTSFASLPDHLKSQVINKKGQTLETSEAAHTGEKIVKGTGKTANLAIEHKKTGFSTDARLLSKKKDLPQLAENRDILKALKSDTFLQPVHFDKQAIVRRLIAEAKSVLSLRSTGFIGIYNYGRDISALRQAQKTLSAGETDKALEQLGRLTIMTPLHKLQLAQIRENFARQDKMEMTVATTSKNS